VPEPILSVEDLSISFPGSRSDPTPEHPAVTEISFSIAEGETLGLVGESGSGKSATSLAILRLLSPSVRVTGSLRFAGTELLTLTEAAMRRHRGREIAMIFQEPMTALNPSMAIGEQIAEAVRVHNPNLSRTLVRARVVESMLQVGLPDVERRIRDYPHQFSGGQRQRILIAMALVNRPRLLIADEPTTALDVTVQAQILHLLRALQIEYRLSMLFISHDLAVVSQIASRVAVMQRGRIVEQAAAPVIFKSPQHEYTRRLLSAAPTMKTDRTRHLADE